MLQFHFNWKTLSAIAGVTWWNFYFRLFPGAIRSPEVVIFLTHLLRHIHGNVLVIWDGLRQHRSRLVREFVAAQHGRLELEFLPAYAPELNPVEPIWGNVKTRELANVCAPALAALHRPLRAGFARVRRHPDLAFAFLRHAGLTL